jgi:hypothetical protein
VSALVFGNEFLPNTRPVCRFDLRQAVPFTLALVKIAKLNWRSRNLALG